MRFHINQILWSNYNFLLCLLWKLKYEKEDCQVQLFIQPYIQHTKENQKYLQKYVQFIVDDKQ